VQSSVRKMWGFMTLTPEPQCSNFKVKRVLYIVPKSTWTSSVRKEMFTQVVNIDKNYASSRFL